MFLTIPAFFTDEISKQLIDSDAKVIISQGSICPNVKAALEKMQKRIPIVAMSENVSYSISPVIIHSVSTFVGI